MPIPQEYRIEHIPSPTSESAVLDALNEAGADGWILRTVDVGDFGAVLILSRPKPHELIGPDAIAKAFADAAQTISGVKWMSGPQHLSRKADERDAGRRAGLLEAARFLQAVAAGERSPTGEEIGPLSRPS